ncbi:MAG: hypothetical protein CMJ46_14370 [Planctomyces sp.]|nr:hypothetical protein [Planctomyces sp.]
MREEKKKFDNNLEILRTVIKARGGTIYYFYYEPVAQEDEIREVELKLGITIPEAYRLILLNVSGYFNIGFSYEKDDSASPFPDVFSGRLAWGVRTILEFEEMWRQAGASNDDFWDKSRSLYPIHTNNGGGITAIEIEGDSVGAIYHLGMRMDDPAHKYLLAENFMELVNRLFLLGLPHWEGDCFLEFTSGPTSGLEPFGKNAETWRKYLGLDISQMKNL